MNHSQKCGQSCNSCKRPCWCTWLRWLVAAILALLLLRGCMGAKAPEAPAVVASAAPVVAAVAPTPAPAPASVESNMAKNAACADTLKQAVEFDTGSAKLTAKGAKQLDMVSDCLKEGKFEVAGHTDNQGDDAANQKLSEARANAVVTYLGGKGVDASRMSAKGYGETQPVGSNDTSEGRQQNRRIAFVSQ